MPSLCVAFGTEQNGSTAFGLTEDGTTAFGYYTEIQDMELAIMTMFANICRAYPATTDGNGLEAKCQRPQAFAVLEKLSDLDADNLNKSSPKYASAPYFFSHRFEDAGRDPAQMAYDYPLLALAYNPMQFNLRGRRKEHRYRYNIAVFDQNEPDKSSAVEYCTNRTMEQQSHDLKQILLNVLNELNNWSFCQHETNGTTGLFVTAAIPSGYMAVHSAFELINSDEIEAEYIRDAYSDKVSAVFANIEFSIPRCEPDLSFTYTNANQFYNPNCESC